MRTFDWKSWKNKGLEKEKLKEEKELKDELEGLKEDAKHPETDLEKVANEVLKEDEEEHEG
ncbi:hypothetical protein [Archaeoglobus profundus]|uniref:Uncharacterized protein n=1 Tax=Archaeoglobus profundus (strain DSM 5631 / JCM 9629 / NBRC 100127 / Av18) TaxID=572546 RepID=D2RFN0_ARCPA|nr:hypothetical protein [Archaeoglobus profundus]ADB57105.1 hypothetical protein Arcpr_0027 [Archaeoglobus profundus DSM 5631]